MDAVKVVLNDLLRGDLDPERRLDEADQRENPERVDDAFLDEQKIAGQRDLRLIVQELLDDEVPDDLLPVVCDCQTSPTGSPLAE